MEMVMLLHVSLCDIRNKNIEKFDNIIHTCIGNISNVIRKEKIGEVDSINIEEGSGSVGFRLSVDENKAGSFSLLSDIVDIYSGIEKTMSEIMDLYDEDINGVEVEKIFLLNLKDIEKEKLVGNVSLTNKNNKLKL